MLLRLALRTLNEKTTITELTAIQQVVARLKPLDLTPAALTAIDQLLLDAGIDAQADLGDSDLLQAYVDVL